MSELEDLARRGKRAPREPREKRRSAERLREDASSPLGILRSTVALVWTTGIAFVVGGAAINMRTGWALSRRATDPRALLVAVACGAVGAALAWGIATVAGRRAYPRVLGRAQQLPFPLAGIESVLSAASNATLELHITAPIETQLVADALRGLRGDLDIKVEEHHITASLDEPDPSPETGYWRTRAQWQIVERVCVPGKITHVTARARED